MFGEIQTGTIVAFLTRKVSYFCFERALIFVVLNARLFCFERAFICCLNAGLFLFERALIFMFERAFILFVEHAFILFVNARLFCCRTRVYLLLNARFLFA